MQIAYQGEPGAFSEAAVYAHFGNEVIAVAKNSFEAVFDSVESQACDYGLIPIENSLAGSIHLNYDLLLQHQLHIIGERFLRVQHCLIGCPGTKLSEIKQVISHPQALGQCRNNLSKILPNAKAEAVYDTAGAVKIVAAGKDRSIAAIASRHAAEIYEMEILAEGIEDNPNNFTRFLAISRKPVDPQGHTKTTMVFSLKNEPGALYRSLEVFANRQIDLTKIESRPLIGTPWDYLFYVDMLGAESDPKVAEALKQLENYSIMQRVFGSYRRHKS